MNVTVTEPAKTPRFAICMTGEPRESFELVLPSLMDNVLNVHRDADVYVSSSRDLPVSALDRRAVQVLRLDRPDNASIVELARNVTWYHGKSGEWTHHLHNWVQQLRKTWMCLQMIKTIENTDSFEYVHVMRIRLDSFWFAPLPRIMFDMLKQHARGVRGVDIVTPAFASFGGVNDRFVFATRHGFDVYASLFQDSMRRSKALRALNPEIKMFDHLKRFNMSMGQVLVPYCLIALQSRCPFCRSPSEARDQHVTCELSFPTMGGCCRPLTERLVRGSRHFCVLPSSPAKATIATESRHTTRA